MSANQKMKTTQLILIKLRNCPSTSSQSAGKWWPQLLFSHQPWTPEKEILQTNISFCLDSETESRKCLQISVQKSQCRFLSMFPRQIPLAYVDLWQSPDPASHPIFTFLQVFPWYSETSCALQAKVNFLSQTLEREIRQKFQVCRTTDAIYIFWSPLNKKRLVCSISSWVK